MPTKLKRYSVSIPDDILPFLQEGCGTGGDKVGKRILSILTKHYRKIETPIVFRSQPVEAESRRAHPLVFEAPVRQVAEPSLNRRASLGRGKS